MSQSWPVHDGVLQVGTIPVDRLANSHGTPCYVTDGNRIQRRYQEMTQAFAGHGPCTIAYACKANTSLAILKLFANAGASVDVVSPGEAHAALHVGIPPDRIFFTGTNPRTDELEWLVRHHIQINLDSLSMAQRIVRMADAQRLGVRINPGVGAGHHEHVVTGSEETKFGLHADALPALCALLAQHGHTLTRLHAHIGSGVMDQDPFLILIDAMHRTAEQVRGLSGVALDTIDLGGGLGVPYHPTETALDLPHIARAITEQFRADFGPTMQLFLEPGRFLVADSTILLTRVNTIKPTPHVTFAGIDAGFNTLLRPVLYDAYHHIVAATKMNAPATHRYTICGPICETGDVLGRQRELPALAEDDLLAVCDVGAYGFAMASTYNGRPLPAEVLVLDGQDYVIRHRGNFDDLLRGQTVPDVL